MLANTCAYASRAPHHTALGFTILILLFVCCNVPHFQKIECTYSYGALDQTARKINVAKFRANKTSVLLVTDVAARGIDIPLLDYVSLGMRYGIRRLNLSIYHGRLSLHGHVLFRSSYVMAFYFAYGVI